MEFERKGVTEARAHDAKTSKKALSTLYGLRFAFQQTAILYLLTHDR